MGKIQFLSFSLINFLIIALNFYQETKAAKLNGNIDDVPPTIIKSQPFSPQVVFQCGYRNRYLSKDGTGEWITDPDVQANCLKGKLDILKYCRKVYPTLEITNIVESSHFYEISNWCKLEGQPCKWSFWVKPYRCVVGPFESEALLVPESCHFGHVDDRNTCKDFDYWNGTAHSECEKRSQTPSVKSFAMLEPCGLDMFSGVEFVCCPKQTASVGKKDEPRIDLNVKVKLDKEATDLDDDEDDYSDEDDDDDDDDDDADIASTANVATNRPTLKPIPTKKPRASVVNRSKITTSTTTQAPITTTDDESDESDSDEDEDENTTATPGGDEQDPYFRIADPDREHAEYLAAIERLEKRHREKVAKVMKEWSDLETRYQEMKEKDPNRGEQFRSEMTTRFQRTVSALEEENRDEKRQIEEVHQQRVNAGLNERKRETMKAFRDALAAPKPQSHKILRTLQAYIRAEEKDRVHALNRYRHLLKSDPDAAAVMKPDLTRKLAEVDKRINGTIDMLDDVPEIKEKVKPAIMEFWQTFRDENTPKFVDDTVTWTKNEKNNDDELLDSYKKQYQEEFRAKQRENEAMEMKSKKEETLNSNRQLIEKQEIVKPILIDEKKSSQPIDRENPSYDDTAATGYDDAEQSFVQHEDVQPSHSFNLKESIQHEMVMNEEFAPMTSQKSHYGYVVFGVAGVTLIVAMLGGILFVKRRFSARGQGFVEVDPCNPEERHVDAMQVNGYENPTYKYFDDKTA